MTKNESGELAESDVSSHYFVNNSPHFLFSQNRDRLELYVLHKQSVQDDAPSSLPPNVSATDRAKYQAWRSNSGILLPEAMRLYCQEADRQIRVYGLGRNNGNSVAMLSPTPNRYMNQQQQQQPQNEQ